MSFVFHVRRLDPLLSGQFYNGQTEWFLGREQPWLWLFEYGTIPGLALTLGCLIAWFLSHFVVGLVPYRRYFLLIFLTAAIGAGILVNGLLKDYWGRPRPRQTVEFGGHWEYRQVCEIGTPGRGQSFPCGHCTMGYLFTLLFFLRKKNKLIAYLGGSFGVGYGVMISAARVVQGAHFVQDAIWSAGVLWLVAIFLNYFVLRIEEAPPPQIYEGQWGKKLGYGFLVALVVSTITVLFMTRRPYYRSYDVALPLPAGVERLKIKSNFTWEIDRVRFDDQPQPHVRLDAKGFGWTNVYHYFYTDSRSQGQGKVQVYLLEVFTRGYFSELNHDLTLYLPKERKNRLTVEFESRPSLPVLQEEKH